MEHIFITWEVLEHTLFKADVNPSPGPHGANNPCLRTAEGLHAIWRDVHGVIMSCGLDRHGGCSKSRQFIKFLQGGK